MKYEEEGQLDNESLQFLRKLFDEFDTFSTGQLKKEDIEQMFKKMELNVNMDEVMIILDPMSTGYVTFAALASYIGS